MPAAIFPSFLLYCYVNSITPGPANLCSLSTALRYGKTAALRQWRGLALGFFLDSMAAVVLCRVLGDVLGGAVRYLSWLGAAYILYLAWHTLRSAGTPPEQEAHPPGFRRGLLVNLTNVKVILYCFTALGSFVLPYTRSLRWLLGVGLFLLLTGPVCNLLWVFLGVRLQRLFSRHQKAVDLVMAAALALCALSLLLS